ncbi:MAG TPA: hypothetical protein ENK57_25765 [Polyangiaceae bacterium]|nr:hypothetical protein [Polyangiaceae bacterium]
MSTSNEEPREQGSTKTVVAAFAGVVAMMGGAGLAALELAFMFRGRETGMAENNEAGCMTLLGILPMLLGGYLCGGVFAVMAIVGLVIGFRSKTPLVVLISGAGLLAALAGLLATAYSMLDTRTW